MFKSSAVIPNLHSLRVCKVERGKLLRGEMLLFVNSLLSVRLFLLRQLETCCANTSRTFSWLHEGLMVC